VPQKDAGADKEQRREMLDAKCVADALVPILLALLGIGVIYTVIFG
jgi:hypothetical protein